MNEVIARLKKDIKNRKNSHEFNKVIVLRKIKHQVLPHISANFVERKLLILMVVSVDFLHTKTKPINLLRLEWNDIYSSSN